ncbi:helix-turn-helix transcriptional regulator [Priestia megaterium]|uniref:helix-turn-helix transcriptional regulator n=1 Tax=Priestia megaterium TaxID=1404 RepID=UPI000BFB26D0|nr:helix-turn-helix transcriptional regulator [Priestia megaterium]PGQ88367.1 Replication termination protein [Priestia megaterium]
MNERQRESTGFLLKQRAFLKVFLITEIEQGRSYGLQLRDILLSHFQAYGFKPHHSEIYHSLHELTEAGILRKREELEEGAKYKKLSIYTIEDKEKAAAYKKLVKADLDRSQGLINKALSHNFA